MTAKITTTYFEERQLWDSGIEFVAGVDEAGMGCLAGPVCAGAVILSPDFRLLMAQDSKKLTAKQREEAAAYIKEKAVAWAVGFATPQEIDEINIRKAGALAMRRAVEALKILPQFLLVDAFKVPIDLPQKGIIRGDAKVKSIAAASIIAKTTRDALMVEMDIKYPGYGFARHAGYGTAVHMKALNEIGPCPEHRMSYEPVRLAKRLP